MKFAYVASALLGIASLAVASPLAAAKPDVLAVLTAFRATELSIVPQLSALAAKGEATPENVAPLISELTAAANTAAAGLKGSSASGLSTLQAATLTAGIFDDIAGGLADAAGGPNIAPLAQGDLAGALAQVLSGVETAVSGVISLVGALVTDVAEILATLALDLLPAAAPAPTAAPAIVRT